MNQNRIDTINNAIERFFEQNSEIEWIPAKKIMPSLIEAGVFVKDEKNGLPFRRLLRLLDEDEQLERIPFVHAKRTESDVYWYLVREGGKYTEPEVKLTKSQIREQERLNNDENYLLNLCDELLEAEASRHHRFDFVLGDPHADGVTKTPLPIDAYYLEHNLAIDFWDNDRDMSTPRYKRMTVSGITRAEQIILYRNRKRKALKKKQIDFIEIDFSRFERTEDQKLKRNRESDIALIKRILKKYVGE